MTLLTPCFRRVMWWSFVLLSLGLKAGAELPDLAPPKSTDSLREFVVRDDLDTMFLEHPTVPGQGRLIRHDSMNMFIYYMRKQLDQQPEGRKILLGCLNLFPEGVTAAFANTINNHKTGELYRAKTLRTLLYGHTSPPNQMTASGYIDEIYRRYDKVLLPCFLAEERHFIVFEIALRSPRGRYIKIWDGMSLWNDDIRSDLQSLIDTFFPRPDDRPTVYRSEGGDPVQPLGTYGCGPFAVLTIAYLCHGLAPPPWTGDEEAVARHYLWGCLLQRAVLPPPKQRLSGCQIVSV